MNEYEKLLSGGQKLSYSGSLKLKPFLVGVGILLVIGLVYIALWYGPKLFKEKDDGGKINLVYSSNLINGDIVHVPDNLEDSIIFFLKKGKEVVIHFYVDNTDNIYKDKYVIGSDISGLSQTQERVLKFRQEKLEELKGKIASYERVLASKPLKIFAIGIDITEGWNGQFALKDYLSDDDVSWISDPDKKHKIILYTIGYNPIPGKLSWDNKTIKSIDSEAQAFLGKVVKPLPQTQLLAQIHWILSDLDEYNQPNLKIVSDLVENTERLSGYKKNITYSSFIEGDEKFIQTYMKTATEAAGVRIKESNTTHLHFLVPSTGDEVLGRNAEVQKWQDAIKNYLTVGYPNIQIEL